MDSAAPEAEPRALWCASLLERLRLEGFDIGVGQVLSIERLLDRIGPVSSSANLKTALSPIVARNPEEQRRFYEVFEEYLAATVVRRDAGAATPEAPAPAPVIDHRHPTTRIQPVPVIPWWQHRRAQLAGLLIVVAVAAIGGKKAYRWVHPESGGSVVPPPPPPPASPPPPDTAGVVPGLVKPLDLSFPADPAPARDWRIVRYGAAGLPLLALAWLAWRRRRRRDAVAERELRADAPYVWPIRIPAATTALYPVSDFAASSRVLRRRQEGTEVAFSVERTIGATIEAAGFPTVRYEPLTRPAEYVALIERASRRDHQAMFFDSLIDRLAADGVFITQYFFEHDPRVCFTKDSARAVRLADLARQREGDRLLIFADGYNFLDPLQGTPLPWLELLEGWSDRALLTPVPPRHWGRREAMLRRSFAVLPATLEGIRAAADHFEIRTRPDLSRWKERDRSKPQVRVGSASEIGELRQALGDDLFRWLAACAAYPELHWDLTALLGGLSEVGTGVLTEPNVLRLIRLPWFRDGRMSAEFQTALLAELARMDRASGVETERAVRQTIVRVLEQEQVKPQSVAGLARRRELLRQYLYLYLEKPAVARRAIGRLEKETPAEEMLQDVTVVRALESAAANRQVFRLPAWFRRWLWRGGIPGLGPTRLAAAGGAVLATVAALVLIPASPPPVASLARDTVYAENLAVAGPVGTQLSMEDLLIAPRDSLWMTWTSSNAGVVAVDSVPGAATVRMVGPGRAELRPGPKQAGKPIRVEVGSTRDTAELSTALIRSDIMMPAGSLSRLGSYWGGVLTSCWESVARVVGRQVQAGVPGSTILIDGVEGTGLVGVRVIHVVGAASESLERFIEEPIDRWSELPTPMYESAMRQRARAFAELLARDSTARLEVMIYFVGERYIEEVNAEKTDGPNPRNEVNRRLTAMSTLLTSSDIPSDRFDLRHEVSGLNCGGHSFGPAVHDGDLDRVFVDVVRRGPAGTLGTLALAVDSSTRTLNAGDTTRIGLRVSGDRSGLGADTVPKWSSSSAAVAQVSQTGLVRAQQAGIATVTVGLGSVTARVPVRVNAPRVSDSVAVPDLTGQSLGVARRQLNAVSLVMGRVDSGATGTCTTSPGIVGTIPTPGTRLLRGSAVRVMWGQGQESTVRVPNLVGMQLSQARSILVRLCLRLGAVRSVQADPRVQGPVGRPGTILRQTPAAGTVTKRRDSVSVEVAVMPTNAPPAPADTVTTSNNRAFATRIFGALLVKYDPTELDGAIGELDKGRPRLDLLRATATRREASVGGRLEFIQRVFQAVVCRAPTDPELKPLLGKYRGPKITPGEIVDSLLGSDPARRVRATCIGGASSARGS